MIGKWFYRKDINLMHTEADFRIGIADVDWTKIKVTDDKVDLIWKHWSITGPTYARGRSIAIEGYIIALTRANTSKGMDWLRNLFCLQGQLGTLELSEFKAVDEQLRERVCQAKVDTTVDFDIEQDNDHNDWSLRRFRVTLFAPDPLFYSTVPNIETGAEGNYWGFVITDIGFSIGNDWFSLDSIYNEITLVGSTSIDTPIKIEIEVIGEINSPLIVYNLNNGSSFILDVNTGAGSTIVIDSSVLQATLNGVDVTANRLPWSSRPSVFGVTQFIIFDEDGGLTENDFNVEITFYDTFI